MRKAFSRKTIVFAGMGVAALASAAIGLAAVRQQQGPSAAQALAWADRSMKAGNYSAARNHALEAIHAAPAAAAGHLALARAYLRLGQGLEAEAELDRAANAGQARDTLHALYAEADVLQGDADGALDETGKGDASDPEIVRAAALATAAKGDIAGGSDALRKLLANHPDDTLAWTALAQLRYTAGDIATGRQAASEALRRNPDDTEALVLRARMIRDSFGLAASLPWYEAALQRDAYYLPALTDYAATLGDLGRNQDMLAVARKALAARPTDPQTLYLMAVLAARAGNDDLSRDLLGKAGAMAGSPGGLLLGGALDYKDGAYELALKQWRDLLARQPLNMTVRRLVAAALLRSGDAVGTIEVLSPLVTRPDADSYAMMLMARALEAEGKRADAVAWIDRAARAGGGPAAPFRSDDSVPVLATSLAEQSNDPTLRVGYLRGLVATGNRQDALDQAEVLVRSFPGAPSAHLALGDTLAAFGRFDAAASAYRDAADIRFDEPTMLRLADAEVRAGDRQAAAQAVALYLDQNPGSLAARRLVAGWQIDAGQYDDAVASLEAIRRLTGNRDPALLAQLAYAYTGGGDPDTGAAYAQTAYRLSPMSPDAADAYGWALYEQGRNEPARQLLEKAAALAPRAALVRWHLAQAYADLGRGAEAKAQIALALSDPTFAEKPAAQALLKELG